MKNKNFVNINMIGVSYSKSNHICVFSFLASLYRSIMREFLLDL
jgi:hypothetical protein